MYLRALFAAMLLFSGTQSVSAGLIIAESASPAGKNVDELTASMLADLNAAQDEQQQRGNVDQGDSTDMANVVVSQSHSVSSAAFFGNALAELPVPAPRWVVALANATLPISPVLDGLLKPS